MDAGGGAGAVLSPIRVVPETGSTNADLLAAALTGAAEGDWLVAERQTAGRGREGRTWASPTGNLYASTLVRLRPGDPPAPGLALVAGVALAEAAGVFLGNAPSPSGGSAAASLSQWEREGARPAHPGGKGEGALQLKWPNDLLLGGAKLAGILLERQGEALVAGFGVNLAHHPDHLDRPVTHLGAHAPTPQPLAFAETLAEGFARWLARWRGEGLAPVRTRWLERAHPVGTALSAALPEGGRADGLFEGLDADGALRLRLADGSRRVIHAGDVFLL